MTEEDAPTLRVVWRDLAMQVAALVRAHPPLGPRLTFAPTRAMHAYAAALHAAADGTESASNLARRLEETHPRTLFMDALPGCLKRHYALLDRCGDAACPAPFYRKLHAALVGPRARLLDTAETIDLRTLQFVAALGDMDPRVGNAGQALSWCVDRAEAYDDMLRLLRGLGVDYMEGGSTSAAGKPFRNHIRRQYNAIAMPIPDFEPPPGLHFVLTVGEVRSLVRRYENCLSTFGDWPDTDWLEFVAGTRIYLEGNDPRLVACLRRLGRRVWWIEQMAGPHNTGLPAGLRREIEKGLSAVGVDLLRAEPNNCVARLLDYRSNTVIDEEEEEEEDESDKHDGEVDLAA